MSRGGKRPGSGRPKGTTNKATADIRAMAQVYTPMALKTLHTIMCKSASHAARVSAAKELLDRGYGRAAQTIDATVRDERMVVAAPPPSRDADEWVSHHGPH